MPIFSMYVQYIQWVPWKKQGLCHCVYILSREYFRQQNRRNPLVRYVRNLEYRAVHSLAATERLLPTEYRAVHSLAATERLLPTNTSAGLRL